MAIFRVYQGGFPDVGTPNHRGETRAEILGPGRGKQPVRCAINAANATFINTADAALDRVTKNRTHNEPHSLSSSPKTSDTTRTDTFEIWRRLPSAATARNSRPSTWAASSTRGT